MYLPGRTCLATPMTPLAAFHAALDHAAASTADDAFVIAAVDDQTNRYAQFLPTPGGGLVAELVDNQYLAHEHQLSGSQQEHLREQGWSGDGTENWSRELPPPASAEDRLRFAEEAIGVLREVYRAGGPLRVEANLDASLQTEAARHGVGAPSSPPDSRRILWLVALAIGSFLLTFLLLRVI